MHICGFTHICIYVYVYMNRYDPKYLSKLSLVINDHHTSSSEGTDAGNNCTHVYLHVDRKEDRTIF